MITKVCILDYGSGNVTSVSNMVSRFSEAKISNAPKDIQEATHLILPGVGSFGGAMEKILDSIPIDILRKSIDNGKPFLGICVGMQVLAVTGMEFGTHQGLGLLPGIVRELDPESNRLPHIGWNNLLVSKPHKLLAGITNEDDFYFVHSYVFGDLSDEYVLATTEYGSIFPSVVAKDNVMGTQFHPEKSQSSGIVLVKNFLNIQ